MSYVRAVVENCIVHIKLITPGISSRRPIFEQSDFRLVRRFLTLQFTEQYLTGSNGFGEFLYARRVFVGSLDTPLLVLILGLMFLCEFVGRIRECLLDRLVFSDAVIPLNYGVSFFGQAQHDLYLVLVRFRTRHSGGGLSRLLQRRECLIEYDIVVGVRFLRDSLGEHLDGIAEHVVVLPAAFLNKEKNLVVDGLEFFYVFAEDEAPVQRRTVLRHLPPCSAGFAFDFTVVT